MDFCRKRLGFPVLPEKVKFVILRLLIKYAADRSYFSVYLRCRCSFFREWDDLLDSLTTATVENLHFNQLNFCPLSSAEFAKVLHIDGLRGLFLTKCLFLASQLSDDFLKKCSHHAEIGLIVRETVACNRREFDITDEGILEILFAKGPSDVRRVELCHTAATEQLPRKIFEVSVPIVKKCFQKSFRN